MTFKTLLMASIAIASAAAIADEPKLKLEPKYEVGAQSKLNLELNVQVGGGEALLTAARAFTVKNVDAGKVQGEVTWDNLHAIIGGAEQPLPFSPYRFTIGLNGDIETLEGGIEGSDTARTFLLSYFPLPDKELGKGDTTTFTMPARKESGLPERKVTETYVGQEDVNGAPAYKFKVKVEEVKGEALTLDSTFWVRKDASVVKEDGKFTNLPVPQAGGNADGTIKLNQSS
jgi:hypothetical protein